MSKLLLVVFTFVVSTLAARASETFPLQDFTAFGIDAKAVKLVDPRLKKLSASEDQYYLEVKLGRLTRKQYDSMMALYGNVSQVPYDSRREYDLVDFLHPAIQATVNQVFVPVWYDTGALWEIEDESLPEEDAVVMAPFRKSGLGSFANCWNTTTEILRLQHASVNPGDLRYRIFWYGRWDINDELKSDELSSRVEGSGLRAGDALLVSNADGMDGSDGTGMIQHTALMLSESLVFEKTDSSEDDPYRIAFRADVLAKYKKLFAENLRLEYRRYNQPGQKTFEMPEIYTLKDSLTAEGFTAVNRAIPSLMALPVVSGCETGLGGGCDVTNSEFHDFKLIQNPKTGRGILLGSRKLLDRFLPLNGK